MLKVKINNKWYENVISLEKYDHKNEWFVGSLNGNSLKGQIQDIKWVEDEPEEIEELDSQNWNDEYHYGTRLEIIFDKLNTVIKTLNNHLKE